MKTKSLFAIALFPFLLFGIQKVGDQPGDPPTKKQAATEAEAPERKPQEKKECRLETDEPNRPKATSLTFNEKEIIDLKAEQKKLMDTYFESRKEENAKKVYTTAFRNPDEEESAQDGASVIHFLNTHVFIAWEGKSKEGLEKSMRFSRCFSGSGYLFTSNDERIPTSGEATFFVANGCSERPIARIWYDVDANQVLAKVSAEGKYAHFRDFLKLNAKEI